jgi:uncharacterized LabA/DUF88 family protein
LVDGFNLYHSLRDLERDSGDPLHWLDLSAMCSSYMGSLDPKARGFTVYYFSALAHHISKKNPGAVERHERFITALRATGVVPVLSRFKPKQVSCLRYKQLGRHCTFSEGESCDGRFTSHEEKETDVAIASKLLELAASDETCHTAAIMGGDSDLLPAIHTAKILRPELTIAALFPYKRRSEDIRRAVDIAIRIRPEQYSKHQLPDVVTSIRGVEITRPESW